MTVLLVPEYVCPSVTERARMRSAAQADRLRLWSDYLLSFPSRLSWGFLLHKLTYLDSRWPGLAFYGDDVSFMTIFTYNKTL